MAQARYTHKHVWHCLECPEGVWSDTTYKDILPLIEEHKLKHNPMSNSTQNTFSETMRGNSPEKAKIMSDAYDKGLAEQEALTQNDWEKQITKSKHILQGMNKALDLLKVPSWSEELQEAYDKGYEKGLADARKEVIDKIKQWAIKNLGGANFEEIDGLNELLDVLATLREE